MKVLEDLAPRTTRAGRKDWRWRFLDVLSKTHNISAACKSVRISRDTVYRHRRKYQKFEEAWDAALTKSVELLEMHLWKRALNKNDKFSHLLLMFALKKERPEYRDSYVSIVAKKAEETVDAVAAAAALKAAWDTYAALQSQPPGSEGDTEHTASSG